MVIVFTFFFSERNLGLWESLFDPCLLGLQKPKDLRTVLGENLEAIKENRADVKVAPTAAAVVVDAGVPASDVAADANCDAAQAVSGATGAEGKKGEDGTKSDTSKSKSKKRNSKNDNR